jgi:hypothetical protein
LKARQGFSENVSQLIVSGNVLDRDCLGNDVRPEVMKPYREVFGARSRAVICGNFNATAIVFKNSAMNGGCGNFEFEAARLKFANKVHKANNVAEGRGEGDIFRFGSGEGDECLHFG